MQFGDRFGGIGDDGGDVQRTEAQAVSVQVDRRAVARRAERVPLRIVFERNGRAGAADTAERLRAGVRKEHALLRLIDAALPAHVRRLRVEGGQVLAHELPGGIVHAERVEAVTRVVAHGGRLREGHPDLVRREEGERAARRKRLRVGIGIDGHAVDTALARREVHHQVAVRVHFRLEQSCAAGVPVETERRAVHQKGGHREFAGADAPRTVETLRDRRGLEPHGHLEAVGALRRVAREYPLRAGGVQPVERHIPRRHFAQRRHRARRDRKSQSNNTSKTGSFTPPLAGVADKISHRFSSL